jgi:hypothetical protein
MDNEPTTAFEQGREMVDFLKYALHYHIGQEWNMTNVPPNEHLSCVKEQLERAFLITDIHAQHALQQTTATHLSGATVAICLLQVR